VAKNCAKPSFDFQIEMLYALCLDVTVASRRLRITLSFGETCDRVRQKNGAQDEEPQR
jgi:hypothetical protein